MIEPAIAFNLSRFRFIELKLRFDRSRLATLILFFVVFLLNWCGFPPHLDCQGANPNGLKVLLLACAHNKRS